MQDGWGTLGLGDKKFGVSVDLLKHADAAAPAFVSTHSTSWRIRASEQICETDIEPKSTRSSCYQQRGFCLQTLAGQQDRYMHTVDHLLKFVQQHRKSHLVRGKNAGPNVGIPHPMLLAVERSHVFVSFRVVDVCFV